MATRFAQHLLSGTIASRPAATAVPAGTLYSSTDETKVYQSDGATWSNWHVPGAAGIPATILDAKGDLVAASAADTAARLPVGTNGQVLTADSAQTLGMKWAAAAGGMVADTLWDAKGDLAVASAADTGARLAVGSDGHVLTVDSAQTLGVKWAAAGGGGGGDGWGRQRTGSTADRWYCGGVIAGGVWSNNALTANRLYALPFVPSKAMTIDAMGFVVNGSSAGNTRLGIYSDDGNLYPNALLDESSSLSTNSDGAIKDTTNISLALTAGTLYWLAYVTSTGTPGIRGPVAPMCIPILGVSGSDLSLNNAGFGWHGAHTFGALPGTYPASATMLTSYSFPAIFVRGV